MIPSFESGWGDEQRTKPRILVLEVRPPKHPERPPVAFLVVERNEILHRDSRDNSVFDASITLSYEVITDSRYLGDGQRGEFSGGYSKTWGVSLTSSSFVYGAVFLDPSWLRGHRVGTYLMNEIVTWIKRWPDAEVKSIELNAGQGGDENRDRRNEFYEQFGLEFDYSDPEHRAGKSKPMLAKDLNLVEKWKDNITEHRMFDFLANTLAAKESALSDLKLSKQSVGELIAAQRRAERHPIRWALRELYSQSAPLIFIGAILALLVGAAFSAT